VGVLSGTGYGSHGNRTSRSVDGSTDNERSGQAASFAVVKYASIERIWATGADGQAGEVKI
jgi:hypothetical protein